MSEQQNYLIDQLTELCEFCNRYFKNPCSLSRHIKVVHEGYRPFSCHCGKDFATKEQFTRHTNSKHSNNKPYPCERGCNKSFASYTARDYHHKINHDKLKYGCPILGCKREYSSKIHLKKHMAKPHEENVMYQQVMNWYYYWYMYGAFPTYQSY